jgi:hypothetical protein
LADHAVLIVRVCAQVLEHDAGREEVQAMTAGWHRLDFDFIDEKTAIYGRFRHIAMTCTRP